MEQPRLIVQEVLLMRSLVINRGLQALSASAALTLFAGCSGGSAIAPKPASPQMAEPFQMRGVSGFVSAFDQVSGETRGQVRDYSCPATGRLVYVSDTNNLDVDVYAGKFAGQKHCGRIRSGIVLPFGLFVSPKTHDLYVANYSGTNILVYHRGQTTPYNVYSDPTSQAPFDVTQDKNGVLIASNDSNEAQTELGSISTWIEGPHGGKFVGNFPMTNSMQGQWLTIDDKGTVYFNDIDATTHSGVVWSVNCPAGVCGTQTKLTGVTPSDPGDMAINPAGNLQVIDRGVWSADTYFLPNPVPSTFPVYAPAGGMAINKLDNHWFISNYLYDEIDEYSYPDGKLISSVPGNSYRGGPDGIAIDP